MKKHFIKILFLALYTTIVNAQCTISPFTVKIISTVIMGCPPLQTTMYNPSNYGSSSTTTITSVWDFGNGAVSTQTNLASTSMPYVTTTYTMAGAYTVSLNVMVTSPTSTCVGSLTKSNYITVLTCTNIKESSEESQLTIYPIPNSGNFNLEITNEISNGKIAIFNTMGQKVYEEKINKGVNNVVTYGLPKGIYYIYLYKNDNRISGQKLIIE